MDINIFTQIGFVVLVGLASKNAILIVEFAKVQREAGMPRHEATLAACRLRLRPIIMTSFAFILGVVPLMVSRGAGSEMRNTLGVAVFSGMLGVTLFGIFLTPVFFFVINRLSEAHLFESALLRRVHDISLHVTTLGVRLLPSLWSRLRKPQHVLLASRNGHNGEARTPLLVRPEVLQGVKANGNGAAPATGVAVKAGHPSELLVSNDRNVLSDSDIPPV
jgi:multidrug efflux pump